MFKFIDLSGQEFGIYEVLSFDHMEYHGTNRHHGMSYYKVRCKKCGETLIMARSHITQGKNKSHKMCSGG